MIESILMTLCTCPDEESAEVVANHLVDQKLAACVNIIPGIRSVYRWQGEVESSGEVLLLIKTMAHVSEAIEQTIKQHHPYELPEIISVPVESGEQNYLAWIKNGITPNTQ